MNRELVAGCLAPALGGAATALAAILERRSASRDLEAIDESSAARRLWLPLVPAAVAWSFVLGWALQEPDASDERVGATWVAAAIAFLVVTARAALRAAWSARCRRAGVAATVGLLRPRVVISEALRERLDGDALAAAVAHEEAHVRHGDPLRLLAGQLAADLQWPAPGARRRLAAWRHAVELARDDEARRSGVRGEDLAHAILAATAVQRSALGAAGAALTGAEEGTRLRHRIERLLGPDEPARPGPRIRVWPLVVPIVLATAAAGVTIGDEVLSLLPGVGR